MNESEALRVVGHLVAAYPRAAIGEETVRAYVAHLLDLDADQAMRAAKGHIERSEWFPTIAEIRRYCGSGSLPSAIAAWALVCSAAAAGWRESPSPPVMRAIRLTWPGDDWPDTTDLARGRRFFFECWGQVESEHIERLALGAARALELT